MISQTPASRSWLAIASFVFSLFALCTLPLPLIPSSFLGILGSALGGIALRRIQRNDGENRDRFFAIGGIVMGIVPFISFCITVTLLAHEIPRLITLLSTELSQLSPFLSREVPRFLALLSNMFR